MASTGCVESWTKRQELPAHSRWKGTVDSRIMVESIDEYGIDLQVTMETKTSTAPGEHAILNLQKANSKLYLGGIPIESSVRIL